eukprot:SAG31_NODE_4972_length_2825_cov_2.318782_3_plen_189_part_00
MLCRWLDDCCRPIKLLLYTMGAANNHFLASAVNELEASAPEAVAAMVQQSTAAQGFGVSADGTQAINLKTGDVRWDARQQPAGLTHVYSGIGFPSAATFVIIRAHVSIYLSQPYCRPLPAVVLEHIAADPSAPLAQRFRLFVRHAWLHGMKQVGELLQAHMAVVETPPREWCACCFSRFVWRIHDLCG